MAAKLNRNVETLREALGLSNEELCRRLGLSAREFSAALSEKKVPESLINKIARELLVEDVILFMDSPPVADLALLDFRAKNPGPNAYGRDTLKTISLAKNIQKTADEFGTFQKKRAIENVVGEAKSPTKAATLLREKLELDEDGQLEASDARLFYNIVRQKLERLEVFVIQSSFTDGSGLCLAQESGYDVIAVNTLNQNYSRRLFTLSHEIYHCVLNMPGISDADQIHNSLERQCNKFAAYFLAPESLVKKAASRSIYSKNFNISQLSRFSKLSKLSLHASVLRLVELGVYSESAIASWNAYLKTLESSNVKEKAGGRRVEEWKYKLARFGFKFAEVFGEAQREGLVDNIDVFRLSGIKPKYQADYFKNASTASSMDAVDE